MPNWCHNRVDVNGEVDEIKRFKEFVNGNQEPFSFESISPMPEELRWVQSPVSIKTQEEIDKYKEENKDSKYMMMSFPITQEMYDEYINKYGCATWYDWANDMWGTKWDARDVTLEEYSEDGELHYTFDTAWGPPEGIHSALVTKFPDLYISWFWDEPGMQMAGYLE
jgi:hypothetical protein